YPGSGPASDVGAAEAAGFTINLPVAPGSGDGVYRSLVDHVAVPLARSFAPQLILISAGFDAHREDPLAECEVTDQGFGAMTRAMRRVGDELAAPVGAGPARHQPGARPSGRSRTPGRGGDRRRAGQRRAREGSAPDPSAADRTGHSTCR